MVWLILRAPQASKPYVYNDLAHFETSASPPASPPQPGTFPKQQKKKKKDEIHEKVVFHYVYNGFSIKIIKMPFKT